MEFPEPQIEYRGLVCKFRPFDDWDTDIRGVIEVNLTRWPPKWRRFWLWVFFGWTFRPYD